MEVCLRRTLRSDVQLTATASSKHLCTHLGQDWFQLQPDFLLRQGSMRWVLDTKWKRLDASLTTSKEKYGLSQTDFYQLFAYGKHYLDGQGDLFLVYPMTPSFNEPLPVFRYSDQMRLWVVPFNLEAGSIVGAQLPSFGLGDALQEAAAA